MGEIAMNPSPKAYVSFHEQPVEIAYQQVLSLASYNYAHLPLLDRVNEINKAVGEVLEMKKQLKEKYQ